jgi:hypothetical protein
MKNYLEFIQEEPDSSARNAAIQARTSQLAKKAEDEVDRTKSPEARAKMTKLRRRELEGITGVPFDTFKRAFNNVHGKP